MPTTVDLLDLAATAEFGRRLGAALFPGAVVALIGGLGAGKTHLTRAVVEGMGGDGRAVSSPTFGLIHEYQARLPVYHFDAYRLHSADEFRDLGVHEYFEGTGVCLIEWADRVSDCLPAEYLRIAFEVTGETTRRLTLEAIGAGYKSFETPAVRPGVAAPPA
jgi:tRNA threonylcarbamoyladenosine biosynthesis protein TsaE